ncbi:PfkB family carbohydrate kinase [Oerskovia flava]|uniref:PfkB family carbohydrate kinase n=1 Tax=Oerskovia flava TaxID=2986422 RepID=UPI00223E9195|nr:PfkB family carbohydrate kinase [Oerskovia sp. JB1-3-2]
MCCGLVTLDVVQTLDRLPAANEKVVSRSVEATFGGPAANAAATAVALGVPARLVTVVGNGSLADVVRGELATAGVDLVEAARPDGARPAVSTVLVTGATGERAVVSTNAGAVPDLDVDVDALLPAEPGGVLLLDGHLPSLALATARRARERGDVVVLDGGSYKPGTAELLALCDAVVLSDDFRLPGVPDDGTLAAVQALGPAFVAQSHGEAPLEVLVAGELSVVPVPRAERVVDTLGAGDVLHGAFAAALARGARPLPALEAAARVASHSVGFTGARGWTSTAALLRYP